MAKPDVIDVFACKQNSTTDEVLALAASLERLSEHPLARAVVRAAQDKNLSFKEISDFENLAGKGIRGKTANAVVMVGSMRLLLENNIQFRSWVEEREAEAKTVVAVACNGELLGLIAVADKVKHHAVLAISRLREQGIGTVRFRCAPRYGETRCHCH